MRRPAAWGQRPRAGVSNGTLFDFTTGSVPTGATVNTSGDTVYRMTSTSTLSAIAPGSGIGIFEDRGRGVAMLVGAGTSDALWKNWITTDYATLDQVFRIRWDHSAVGSYLNTADQAQGPTGNESLFPPRVRKDDSALIEGTNPAVQGYLLLNNASCPAAGAESFFTLWLKDGPSPPTSQGYWNGTAGGARSGMRDPGGSTWHQVRAQGANGGFGQIYIAGNQGVTGATGQLYAAMAMCGSGADYLPLVAGATTSQSSAYDNKIADPSLFVVNGALRAQGKFQQLVDDPKYMVQLPGSPRRTLFSIATPDGECSLYGQYSVAGSSRVDWALKINGSLFLLSDYHSPGVGLPGETSPGVGGSYLSEGVWAIGYDASASLAYIRIGFMGSYYTRIETSGVSATLSTPTAAYLHTNTSQTEPFTALLKEVTAGAPSFQPSPVIVLSDSLNDITGATDSLNRRPTNFVFTDDEAEAGVLSIENLAVHGDTIAYQLDRLNAFYAAFPEAVSTAQHFIVDLGWNVFPSRTNTQTRSDMNALLDRIVAIKSADATISLWVPSPAKSAVTGTAQTHYEEFRTDVLADYYTQSDYNVDLLTRLTAPSMNDGAYGGTVDNLYPPYADVDGQHYQLAGKQAKGALQRTFLQSIGIIP